MSDATAFTPIAQSASQLSENIGDVLASIRRLIAQDEAAEAASAPAGPRPLAAAPAPAGSDAPPWQRTAFVNSALRRRDILAEAQALTRRSEAAFGQMPEALVPLTLAAAERVAPVGADLAARAAPQVTEAGTASPLVLTAPIAIPAASPPRPATIAGQQVAAAAVPTINEITAASAGEGRAAPVPGQGLPAAAVVAGASEAEDMIAPHALPTATVAAPATQTAAAAICPAASPAAAVVPQTAAAVAPPAAPVAADVTGQPPAGATPAAAVPESADDEDCTASILREMIRDVVRQELTGDPAGRMTGNLRSMIMREVAQVLTQGARGGR